jgi:hypothetical protein
VPPRPPRTRAEQDLRATSDAISTDVARIGELEREKRELDPGDPRLKTLSRDVERLAERIDVESVAERQLADEVSGDRAAGQN